MAVLRFYSNEAVNGRALQRATKLYSKLLITTELCYNVELTGECVTVCLLVVTILIIEDAEAVKTKAIVKNVTHVDSPCVVMRHFPHTLCLFHFAML